MAKIGRNERCPCGSDKKYKRCCEELHRRALAEHERAHSGERSPDDLEQDDERVHALFHQVMDWLDAGFDEEAEQAARELLAAYPAEMEGYQGMAEIEAVRGRRPEAARWYRKALALHQVVAGHPECDVERDLRQAITELESGPALPTRAGPRSPGAPQH